MFTSTVASSFTEAGVGVGVEVGVDSLEAGSLDLFSSGPFSRSRRRRSYWRSTILLNASSSTAGLQC